MSFISYAQAGEDVLLWRALASRVRHEVGFYIDVGAYDPDIDSVSRAFYDCGWRGINVEPVKAFFDRFVERRPDEINLPVAVSDRTGQVTFHEIVGHQLGTMVDDYAAKYDQAGLETRSYSVDALTLTEICDRYVGTRPIHFLKIDVEGHEGAALRGMDFRRYRPWVLVIEATEPNRVDIPTHAEWDKYVRWAGYIYAGTSLPNRYYVAREHADLAPYFKLQPDVYERAFQVQRREELELQVASLQEELTETRRLRGVGVGGNRPLTSSDEPLFIGCATDKRYVEPTAVMLASLDMNGGVPEAIIVVACFGLDEADRDVLKRGAGRLATEMRFFDVTRDLLHEVDPDGFTEHYPPAVLGRLLISDFIGDHGGRLLTLDSDMIVNASVRPLFELDLKGEFFAAVEDPHIGDPDYFNSGMTLSELKVYRKYDVGRRCLRYIAEHRPTYPDQDALNDVVGHRWYRLDRSWNFFGYRGNNPSTTDLEGAKIAHFTANPKPWDRADHPGRPLYNRHLARVRKAEANGSGSHGSTDYDFMATSYEVLLGRDLESLAIVHDRSHLFRAEILTGIMLSDEFTQRVLPSLASEQPFPDGRFTGQPTLRHRLWSADAFGVSYMARKEIEESLTWRDLLGAVVRYSSETLDAPSPAQS